MKRLLSTASDMRFFSWGCSTKRIRMKRNFSCTSCNLEKVFFSYRLNDGTWLKNTRSKSVGLLSIEMSVKNSNKQTRLDPIFFQMNQAPRFVYFFHPVIHFGRGEILHLLRPQKTFTSFLLLNETNHPFRLPRKWGFRGACRSRLFFVTWSQERRLGE